MKKIRDALPMNDRMKLLLSVCAVGLALLAAVLIPLAFRADAAADPVQAPADTEETKAALFAEYWNGGSGAADILAEKPETLSDAQTAVCESVIQMLIARCINDQALEHPEVTGREYTVLHGESGTEVRLCRMWMEAKGDWQNWLDVCFDCETGVVYYLYLSRECLSNMLLYQGEESDVSGAEDVARLLGEQYGWMLRYSGIGNGGAATAVYSTPDGGTLCYEIGCRLYAALVDIKLCCK